MDRADIHVIRDTTTNGSKMYENMAKQREKEKGLVPLRINASIVILVAPDRCNEEYAEEFRRRVLCQSV